MLRDAVIASLREALPHLRDAYGVDAILLYGSVARGEESQSSDVDLLVEFCRTPTLFLIARLQEELEERLVRRVDIATRGGLRPHALANALRDAVPI